MPFLRVLRDKRGYETTYLMHWFRDGHRQRSKILYVFRTPPGVRVGRLTFEPAVMRELEARYPDIEFEWRALVENQQVVDTAPEPRRPRGKRRSDGGGGEPRAEGRPEARGERAPRPVIEAPEPPAQKPVRDESGSDPKRAQLGSDPTSPPGSDPGSRPAAHPPRPSIPISIEGSTPDEQVTWLRMWYPKILEQIPHRTHDPARREALEHLAARLNPEPWVGEEAIANGLQAAGEALHRLSRVFARKRRRPRRKPQTGAPGSGPAGGGAAGGGSGEAG